MNINQKAQELAKLIKTTDEFKLIIIYYLPFIHNIKKGGFLYEYKSKSSRISQINKNYR